MNERIYQRDLIKRIKELIPDCVILKNDPRECQGIPDILILFRNNWAMLEVKINGVAKYQPNQNYYIEKFNMMSWAASINPGNEGEVLDALQSAFGITRETRFSQS